MNVVTPFEGIGASVRRKEDLRFLSGRGQYTDDIARPGQDEAGYDRLPLRALHSQTRLWADVRAHLGQVDQPVIVFASREDHVVDPSSLALIRAGIASAELQVVPLDRSYHVATLDYDAEDIFRGSAEFFRAHVGERT